MKLKVVISGPQGVGKTQTAFALASLLRNNGVRKVSLWDDSELRPIVQDAQLHLPDATEVEIIVQEALA